MAERQYRASALLGQTVGGFYYDEIKEKDRLDPKGEYGPEHDWAQKLRDLGHKQSVAAGIAEATSPVASVNKRKLPTAIRGRTRTVAKALEQRLVDFASSQEAFSDLAQKLVRRGMPPEALKIGNPHDET